MKKLRLAELGFSSIFVLVGMLLVAVALPIATRLVQQNQENRSSAAAPSTACTASISGTSKCNDSAMYKCTGTPVTAGSTLLKYSWVKGKSCDYGCRTSTTCAVCKEGTNKGCSDDKICKNGGCVKPTTSNCSYSGTTVTAGSTTCVGKVRVTCSSSGDRSLKDCKYGCSSGKCKCSYDGTIYANNVVRCWSNKLHICTNGDWIDGNSCKTGQKCNNSGNDCVSSDTAVDVTKVEFDKTSVSVSVGSYADVKATVSPSNATHKTLTWTSTKSSVATVNSSGRITGVSAGDAVIKAAVSNGKYATVSVKVTASSTSGASCTYGDKTFKNGENLICHSVNESKFGVVCEDGSIVARKCDSKGCDSTGKKCLGYYVSTGSCSASSASCVSASSCTGTAIRLPGASGCASNQVCCGNSILKCESNKGECVNSSGTMTSGIKCTYTKGSGLTNLSYSCSEKGNAYVCCMPSGSAYVGKCTSYPKGVTSRPDTTCSSGKVVWLDEAGYNGDYDWKCMGSDDKSDSDDDLNCKARKVVDGTAITDNSRACGEKGGICATFGVKLNEGDGCRVAAQPGTVTLGKCPGDSKTVCCVTGTGTTTPTSNGGGGTGGGGNDDGGGDKTVDPTGIELDPTSLSVAVGGSATISATVLPDNANNTTVTWSSDKTNIATVDGGVVTGKAVGTAVITAKTSNNKTATAAANVVAAGSARISFKFSLRGVKPSYTGTNGSYNCFNKLGTLKVDVVNSPTNTYQSGLSTNFSVVSGETNDKGDQVFKVSALVLDSSKFASAGTFNYLKIKGPFHLKRRMCLNGQNNKLPETTTCNINLASDTVYDFSEYILLAGDLNTDGVINSIDYSYVKTRLDANADVSCGRDGDINMDGVVNSIDTNLIKEALSSKDDE